MQGPEARRQNVAPEDQARELGDGLDEVRRHDFLQMGKVKAGRTTAALWIPPTDGGTDRFSGEEVFDFLYPRKAGGRAGQSGSGILLCGHTVLGAFRWVLAS